MKNLKYLIQTLEDNPELADFIYQLIQAMKGFNGKRELIALAKGKDYNNAVDTAIPLHWANKMRDEMQLSPWMIAWDYNEVKVGGKPLDIPAAILIRLSEILKEV